MFQPEIQLYCGHNLEFQRVCITTSCTIESDGFVHSPKAMFHDVESQRTSSSSKVMPITCSLTGATGGSISQTIPI